MASAWGPHLLQVVGVPISASRGSGGGQKLRAVDGGSIHKLPLAPPGRNVVLRPSGTRRSTAGTVAPGTYSTCSGGRWWAWFPRGGACGGGCWCVLQNRPYVSRTSPSVGCECPVCVVSHVSVVSHVIFQD